MWGVGLLGMRAQRALRCVRYADTASGRPAHAFACTPPPPFVHVCPARNCDRYYHRSLQPKKLVDVGFSSLAPRMTMNRLVRIYALPEVGDERSGRGWSNKGWNRWKSGRSGVDGAITGAFVSASARTR